MSGLFDEHKWDIEDIFNWACENTVKIAEGAKARYEIERNFMPQYDMADNENQSTPTDMKCFGFAGRWVQQTGPQR